MAITYVLPFVLYVLGTTIASRTPTAVYPLAYGIVVCVVAAAAAWLLMRRRGLVRPHARVGEAILVGLIGITFWIGLSELRLEERIAAFLPATLRPTPRAGFQPFQQLTQSWAAWAFISVRFFGLVIVVPLVEELFWRGFLLRWFVAVDWQEVPLGKYSATSFWCVTLLFTLAHPEWFAAAVYCALLNGLMYWKKDLWSCMVAHGVSNLVLGVYVLTANASWLW